MNYKTVSKPVVKVIDMPKTNDYKVKIINLFTKISSLFAKKNKQNKNTKYRYVNDDRTIEILSMVNFYAYRYHSLL